MSTGAARGIQPSATEGAGADELLGHATDLIARLVGDRRTVEIGDSPPPSDAEALVLSEDVAEPELLRARLERARDAAVAGTPVLVYVANRIAGPRGANDTAAELRELFAEVPEAVLLEQHRVEVTIADVEGPSTEGPVEPRPATGRAERLILIANLPPPDDAELRIARDPRSEGRRRELERRLAELEERNVALARARIGAPRDDTPGTRARDAERRLLFARIRETLSALLARRRLRG